MHSFVVHIRPRRFAGFFGIIWGLLFFFAGAEAALADEVTGFMDFIYTQSDAENRTATGSAESSRSEGFRQLYKLTLTKSLFPHLYLLTGGVFEKSRSTSDIEGTVSSSEAAAFRPFIDLTLRTPLVTADAGYFRQESTSGPSGGPRSKTIGERYIGALLWRPRELPQVELRWTRTNAFDPTRTITDTSTDAAAFSSTYEPLRSLFLRYDQSMTDSEDMIAGSEVQTRGNGGRVNYSEGFFGNRLFLNANYQISRQEVEIIKSTAGEVPFQLFAFSGLFAVDDTPAQGGLSLTGTIIDGDTGTSAGISIGLPVTVPGARNIGLDFGTARTVSSLSIWIIWNNASLPVEIANAFRWSVYTSTNNESWTLQAANVLALFDPFRNRFDLPVLSLTARYVKVVVNPLTPAQALLSPIFSAAADQQIFVTELQAFRVAQPGTIESRTQLVGLGLRTTLMDTPLLTYDVSYNASEFASGGAETRLMSLINGLSLIHQFSEVFQANARAARTDSAFPQGNVVSHQLSAGLNATPLPTLNHTLIYTGTTTKSQDTDSTQHSLYLTNTASLYRGIDFSMNGGLTHGRSSGITTDSTTMMFGATIAPRSDLSISPYYTASATEQSGGGRPDTRSTERSGSLSVSYAPFPRLYLTASHSWISQTGEQKRRTQSYNASWSPFSGGALSVSVYYSESHQSIDDSISRLLGQSVRWDIARGLYVVASLVQLSSTSALAESESTNFVTELKYSF